MKTIFCLALILGTIAFTASATFAQCDRNTLSPIKCGFYDEGYQDGANDARNNQNSDYRRYRNKLTSQYESFYRQGYDAGYGSAGGGSGYIRWSGSQRSAYDVGYNAGQNDRNRYSTRNASQGNYSGDLYAYFQQGYNDGFDGRQRQYDIPVGAGNYPGYPGNPGNPGYPGQGSSSGTIYWSGRVDDRINIVMQGAMVRTDLVSGTGYGQVDQNSNAVLPRRAVTISATKLDGRGTVIVAQQPNRSNDYTAIVQVSDPKKGADNYRVQISWQPAYQADEPYQSGSVRWKGRVDQTANIVISGSDVQTYNVSGNGVTNVSFKINGYLAHRPGTVTVRKRDGRGSVSVLQQPSPENDYSAVIQVFDPDGGADNYDLEVNW